MLWKLVYIGTYVCTFMHNLLLNRNTSIVRKFTVSFMNAPNMYIDYFSYIGLQCKKAMLIYTNFLNFSNTLGQKLQFNLFTMFTFV